MKPRNEYDKYDVYDDLERTRKAYQSVLGKEEYQKWNSLVEKLLEVMKTRHEFTIKTMFTINPEQELQNNVYERSLLSKILDINKELEKFSQSKNLKNDELTSVAHITDILKVMVENITPIKTDDIDRPNPAEHESTKTSKRSSADVTRALSTKVQQPTARKDSPSNPKSAEPDAPKPIPKTPSPDTTPRFLGQSRPRRPSTPSPDEPPVSPKTPRK